MPKRATPLLNFISASLMVITRFIDTLREDLEYEHFSVPSVPDPRPPEDDPPLRASSAVPEPVGERNRRVIPQDVKIAVSARDGGRCRKCGSTQQLHFDHVIPVSRGGVNSVANIQLLCGACNRAKGAR
jgi:HNH endonuclease